MAFRNTIEGAASRGLRTDTGVGIGDAVTKDPYIGIRVIGLDSVVGGGLDVVIVDVAGREPSVLGAVDAISQVAHLVVGHHMPCPRNDDAVDVLDA